MVAALEGEDLGGFDSALELPDEGLVTADNVDQITAAPPTGIWEMADDGSVHYVRMQTHRRTVQYENRAFWLRISDVGDCRYEGADLGILDTRGRSMTNGFRLTDRSKRWIHGIQQAFSARPLPSAQAFVDPAFKIL